MNCRKAQRLISEKLNGLLAGDDERLLMKHIDACENCKRASNAYLKLESLLTERGKMLPAVDWGDFESRTMRRLFEQEPPYAKPPMRRHSIWRYTAAAAATLLTVAAASTIFFIVESARAPVPDTPAGTDSLATMLNTDALTETLRIPQYETKVAKGYVVENPSRPPVISIVTIHDAPPIRRMAALAAAGPAPPLGDLQSSSVVVVVRH